MLARFTLFFALVLAAAVPAHAMFAPNEVSWGFDLGASYFKDKDFVGTKDSALGGFLGEKVSFQLYNFRLGLQNDLYVSKPKFSGSSFWLINHFLGLQAEYVFFPGFSMSVGPGYTANHQTKFGNTAADSRHGVGVSSRIAYEFLSYESWALNFHIRGLIQAFQNKDGGLTYLAGAGLGFRFF